MNETNIQTPYYLIDESKLLKEPGKNFYPEREDGSKVCACSEMFFDLVSL
jgi:hypothetical protein